MMLRLGKPQFQQGQPSATVEVIALSDECAYTEACEAFESAFAQELANESKARRSLTNLADLVFTE
jgi:hypothetical protein